MAHPIYNRQQLLNRGMVKVKKVAADLGVLPSGDKRLIQSWVDAIIEHQSAQVQEIEVIEAVIDFDDDSYEGLTKPYVVLVGGEIVHRAATYQLAERHCKWHGYTLVDSQTLAQQELEVELEVQATEATAVTEESANPEVSFISPTGFGYHEAVVNNQVIATIDAIFDRDVDGMWWSVESPCTEAQTFDSYEEAEEFIKNNVEAFMGDERGSGRITQPIEDMGMTIEDINFRDSKGQQYSVRVHGVLAGYIWLNDDLGWTLNGEDFQDEWRPVAKELVRLTRHEYLMAA